MMEMIFESCTERSTDYKIVGSSKADFLSDERIIKPLFSSSDFWELTSTHYLMRDDHTIYSLSPFISLGDSFGMTRCILGLDISVFSVLFVQEFISAIMGNGNLNSNQARWLLLDYVLGEHTVDAFIEEVKSGEVQKFAIMWELLPSFVHYLKSWRSALYVHMLRTGNEMYDHIPTIEKLNEALHVVENVYGKDFVNNAKSLLT